MEQAYLLAEGRVIEQDHLAKRVIENKGMFSKDFMPIILSDDKVVAVGIGRLLILIFPDAAPAKLNNTFK